MPPAFPIPFILKPPSEVNASGGFILAGCLSSPLRSTRLDLEAPCHSIPLCHRGWAGPWAQDRPWACGQDQLITAGPGHIRTAAPALAEAGLSVRLIPAAPGTGATFIYYYQAGKERGGREEQRRELAVKHPDVMLLTEQIRSF